MTYLIETIGKGEKRHEGKKIEHVFLKTVAQRTKGGRSTKLHKQPPRKQLEGNLLCTRDSGTRGRRRKKNTPTKRKFKKSGEGIKKPVRKRHRRRNLYLKKRRTKKKKPQKNKTNKTQKQKKQKKTLKKKNPKKTPQPPPTQKKHARGLLFTQRPLRTERQKENNTSP